MDGRDRETRAAIGRAPGRGGAVGALAGGLVFGLRSRAWEVTRGVRPLTVPALALLSLGLLVAGLRTAPAPFAWAFAGCWALALAIAVVVLRACAVADAGGR